MKTNEQPIKEVPVLYSNKANCCGCAACYAICPVKAITMLEDSEGFLYPQINDSICVRCYRCTEVCVFKVNQAIKWYAY